MKIAYLILAHKNPSQLLDLVKILNHKNAYFFIHVDKKSNMINSLEIKKLNKIKNVYFINKQFKVFWGSYNQTCAIVELLRSALISIKEINYFILISGQDYPIKSNNYIFSFFKKHYGKEFLKFFKFPAQHINIWKRKGGLERIEFFWFNTNKSKFSWKLDKLSILIQRKLKIKRKFPMNIPLYGGFSWFSITKECAKYVIKFLKKNPKYLRRFKHTRCSDEIFLQTIIINSHLKKNVINDDLRYVDWKSGPQYPKILTVKDYKKLRTSSKLFARKFDYTIDNKIIKTIKKNLIKYCMLFD